MLIGDDMLALIDGIAAPLVLPAVRSVHVARAGEDCKSSNFGALVLEDDTVGLTYTALDGARAALQEAARTAPLIGRSPLEAARLYARTAAWQRALGMAAVNAIAQHLFRRAGYEPPTAKATFDHLALSRDDHLGMVGFFPPLVAQARERGITLTVIELDPQWLGQAEGIEVTLDPARLAGCNKIVCTGTVLVNQTIDALADHFREAEQVLLVGPTLGCLPEPLFARGVTHVGGLSVIDGEGFLRKWRAGEKWRGTTRRYLLSRDTYPGSANIAGMPVLDETSARR